MSTLDNLAESTTIYKDAWWISRVWQYYIEVGPRNIQELHEFVYRDITLPMLIEDYKKWKKELNSQDMKKQG